MTTNLQLDSRQRAMLAEMGVRVWLPETKLDVSSQPVDVLATSAVAVPIRKEPPLRLPVLQQPPVQASGGPVRYVIGNLPTETSNYDCVMLGEPCTGDAEKLLEAIAKALGSKVFAAQMVAATNEEVHLIDQLKTLPAKALLALGPHAAKALLGEVTQAMPFGKLRGTLHRASEMTSPVVVTYHPLQLLRQPLAKAQTWLDLKLAMKALK